VNTSFSIFRQASAPLLRRPTALSIGNFDGVHLGHLAMLSQVAEAARARALVPTVLTFAPHPRQFFAEKNRRPELSPPQINGLRDKLSALSQAGVEQAVLARFNQNFAEMSAEDFIEKLLIKGLKARWLIVGEDFRAALATGDLTQAQSLLGRPYSMTGHVVHGKKLGRTLNMPTLNMRVTPRCAARSGIYVVRVHGLGPESLPGVASLGVRPTVEDDGRILLETHLFDINIDAYGKLICVELLKHLRDEEKFPDLPTLTAAMHADAQHARAYFAPHGL
jgi:riboflavin kinase/FMN adenylyltransferase